MYFLKQIPEDFIVEEIGDYQLDDKGHYAYFLLKKKNHTTLKAISLLAKELGIPEKNIGSAGHKDRIAITTQVISIKNGKKHFESVGARDISLQFLGNGSEEIFAGKLKGNRFRITIRNLTDDQIESLQKKSQKNVLMPNFFGEQRFSTNNVEIGKAILQARFKDALHIIEKEDKEFAPVITNYLQSKENDHIGALQKIPVKILRLYVHSYQSFLFNELLKECISRKIEIDELPLIGFASSETDKKIDPILDELLKKEKISTRDFIIPQLRDISAEGESRKAFVPLRDFQIEGTGDDDLNEKKKKVIVTFSLPRGAYATVLIDYLMQ